MLVGAVTITQADGSVVSDGCNRVSNKNVPLQEMAVTILLLLQEL
jgi:hypothetical protein